MSMGLLVGTGAQLGWVQPVPLCNWRAPRGAADRDLPAVALWRCCDRTAGRLGGLGSSAWERLDVGDRAEPVGIFPQDIEESFLRNLRLLVSVSASLATLLPEGGEKAVNRDLASHFLVAQDSKTFTLPVF